MGRKDSRQQDWVFDKGQRLYAQCRTNLIWSSAPPVNPRYLLLNVTLKPTVALSLRIGTLAYPWHLSNCQKLSFNLKRYVY